MTRITRALPSPAETFELDDGAVDDWLRREYLPPAGPWLRLNLVNAIGGRIAGPSGGSGDLAGGVDRRILRIIRETADVVLVGAGTVRAEGEGYEIAGRVPIAVVTSSGDIGTPQFAPDAPHDALIVLAPAAAGERTVRALDGRARLQPIPERASAQQLVAALHDLGHTRIVCEGGGGLAARMLAADLVDEFCLTTAPVVVAPGPELLGADVPFRQLALAGLLVDETGRSYSRLRRAAA